MTYLIAIAAPLHEEARNPSDQIAHAVWLLKGRDIVVTAQSSQFRAPSGLEGDGPDVISMVISANADQTPEQISKNLQSVQAALSADQCPPTLELLAAGSLVYPDELSVRRAMEGGQDTHSTLILPHPMLHRFARYLVPLAEVAADWEHPVLHRSIGSLSDGPSLQGSSRSVTSRSRDVAE